MSVVLKTPAEIKIMAENGKKMSQIFSQLIAFSQIGVNLLDIEKKAIQLIKQAKGEPGFARVPNYHWATCLNINEGIVHGVPYDYKLKDGDVLTIDTGMYYQGFNSDMSATFLVVKNKADLKLKKYKEINNFLNTGRKTLEKVIKKIVPGNRVGNISVAIQQNIEANGYHPSYNLTGHGIGRELHEDPMIPGVLKNKISQTPILKEGMVIAVEIIYTQGSPDLIVDAKDGWTIKTRDGKISAVFEETMAINKKGALILTKIPFFY